MQTFLPYASFDDSARCLDRQRLGKQRVEAWQIVLAITGRSRGWTSHPATRMWLGYAPALINYALAMCKEWRSRGYNDNLAAKFAQVVVEDNLDLDNAVMPPWLGDPQLHASHRSNLLRKDAVHYGQFSWVEADSMDYVWPTPTHPLPPPKEGTNMSDAVATEKSPIMAAEETIRGLIADVQASINPAIGEKNVARANKRLANVAKNVGIAFGRLEKQTKRALRPKRARRSKTAEPQA